MIDIAPLPFREITISVVSGAALGGIYFGSLWLALRRLGQQHRPATILLVSFAARFGLLLFGFYLIGEGGHGEQLVAALIGLIAVRTLLIRCSATRVQTSRARVP